MEIEPPQVRVAMRRNVAKRGVTSSTYRVRKAHWRKQPWQRNVLYFVDPEDPKSSSLSGWTAQESAHRQQKCSRAPPGSRAARGVFPN